MKRKASQGLPSPSKRKKGASDSPTKKPMVNTSLTNWFTRVEVQPLMIDVTVYSPKKPTVNLRQRRPK